MEETLQGCVNTQWPNNTPRIVAVQGKTAKKAIVITQNAIASYTIENIQLNINTLEQPEHLL